MSEKETPDKTRLEQSLKIRAWIKKHRTPYMKKRGSKAQYHYFDFDDSGNVMTPGTIKALLSFFEILTPKDKETFFKLYALKVDLTTSEPNTASWDVFPENNVPDRFISMEQYLIGSGINVEELKTH